MKRYVLLGVLVWIGAGYSGFFYDSDPILAQQMQFENNIKSIFSKKDGAGRTESIIKRVESLIKEINTANLDAAAKRSLAQTILEAINNDAGLKGIKNEAALERQLELININLNKMSTAPKNEVIPDKNNEYADATDLDDLNTWNTKIQKAKSITDLSNILNELEPESNDRSLQEQIIREIGQKVAIIEKDPVQILRMGKAIRLAEFAGELPNNSFNTFKETIETQTIPKKNKQKYKDQFKTLTDGLAAIKRLDEQDLKNFDIDTNFGSSAAKRQKNSSQKLFGSSNSNSEKTNKDVQKLQEGYQESITEGNQQKHKEQIQEETHLQKLKKKMHVRFKQTIDYLTTKAKNLKDTVTGLFSSGSSSSKNDEKIDTSGDLDNSYDRQEQLYEQQQQKRDQSAPDDTIFER